MDSFRLLRCGGALLGMGDEFGKAWVSVQGFQAGVLFDTQVQRRSKTVVNCLLQELERLHLGVPGRPS